MGSGRRFFKVAATVAALGATGVWAAAAAAAHVTVTAPGVSVGASDATIVFRVPTESDTANTVGLKVQIPTDHPIAGVLVAPQTGWTAKISQTKLATPVKTDDGDITQVVSEIDWTADPDAGIKPGFFGQFTIIAGKLPDGASTVTFKAIQTYSDGKQVAWIDVPAPGSSTAPDHPAPVLQLTAAGDTGPAGSSSTPTSASSSPAATAAGQSTPTVTASTTGASKSAATTGIVLGALGVLLGAAALTITMIRGRTRASRS